MLTIPKTMSTQHPDNARNPFFATNSVLEGDDEVKEAFYAYSHLRCQEQLWDCEGKEVDNFVVKKLLTKYEPFFKQNKLGKDIFLTLRVPNPEVERNEAKILLETLESAPRNFDIARIFYGEDIAPIFEVALPMTTSAESMLRLKEYYSQFVSGKSAKRVVEGDITIGEWVGHFQPDEINVIPLFETMDKILNAGQIVGQYIEKTKVEHLRVWLARSDPALNYGMLSAVLINKISLQRLHEVGGKTSAEIFPILGCGSAPFRGNLKPTNLSCLEGYPSVHTFTIQSAFKYDYEERAVREAVEKINSHKKGNPAIADEAALLPIIEKTSEAYVAQISLLAPLINEFSRHIPGRRRRKLHIGLFGYSRECNSNGNSFTLPRAITLCASLYSLGLPPELLGLDALSCNELDVVKDNYHNFETDVRDALRFVNKDNFALFPKDVVDRVESALSLLSFNADDVDPRHKKVTSIIAEDYSKKNFVSMEENITRAGAIRGFLG